MRATISFDIDIDKVEDTMEALVSQQATSLHIAANILENLGQGPLLPEVTESLDVLHDVISQLEQYKNMLASFEKAKFETLLPQAATATVPLEATSRPVGEVVQSLRQAQETLKNVGMFDEFVSRMSGGDEPPEERIPDEKPSSEG